MKRTVIIIFLTFVVFLSSINVIFSASFEKAKMFYDYGLKENAKKELIEIIIEDSSPELCAKAFNLLGNIMYDENNIKRLSA